MAYMNFSVRDRDEVFSTYYMSKVHARHLLQLPSFLEGDISSLIERASMFKRRLHAPLENGYVLVDAVQRTITQWGIVPGIEVVDAQALGVDAHAVWLKRTPVIDKVLTKIDETLNGADWGGVAPSKMRESLMPYVKSAHFVYDILEDPVQVDFEPFTSDAEFVTKLKELAWQGVRRDWLVVDRPNLVRCLLSFPGWRMDHIAQRHIQDMKQLVNTMIDLTDEDDKAWDSVAERLGLEIQATSSGYCA